MNVAWYNIIQGTGQGGCTAQANFLAQGATIFTAAYDQDTGRDFSVTPANVPVATRAPGLYHYSYAGITKMYFPSKTVGVAVGQNIGGTMSSRSPAGWPTISGTFCDTPSILLSFDAGVTWTWATATPTFQIQAAAASYVGTLGAEAVAYPVRGPASGAARSFRVELERSPDRPSLTPRLSRPAPQHITSGDYMSVFFASKSLGWVSPFLHIFFFRPSAPCFPSAGGPARLPARSAEPLTAAPPAPSVPPTRPSAAAAWTASPTSGTTAAAPAPPSPAPSTPPRCGAPCPTAWSS